MNLLEEESFWRRLPKLAMEKPLILYGMGNGADKLLYQLEMLKLHPAGIFASDEFVRGQSFAGMKVHRYIEAKELFSDMVVLICFGSEKPDVIERIIQISTEQEVYAPHLPLFGSLLADEDFAEKYNAELTAAAAVWADENSTAVYRNYLRYMWTGRIDYLQQICSPRVEAWDLLRLGATERYLDLGAYDGDTVRDFCSYANGKWQQIWALEPDKKNFVKLQKSLSKLPNCQVIQLAIGKDSEMRLFSNLSGRNSTLYFSDENNLDMHSQKTSKLSQVATISLDDLYQNDLEQPPTLIKMDVEGAEEEALLGARQLLAKHKPKLALAAYHRTEDIFRLPLLLKQLNSSYKLYLRHHPYIPGWETNIYAI